ncbi:DUF308 domain-containing protein [Rhizorhabdus dicambivorans]|uniref:DUF308 domain-containing protein n=1 Tax=Rhizorhabdus dicambivorans TaxID=1850238 RepID=UPI000AE47130|nr:DUF308 domain-containing protein [Rhizorhabdus dicambivorans]
MSALPTPNDEDEELGRTARASCVAVGLVFLGLAAFLSLHILRAPAIDVTVVGLTILTGAGPILLGLGLRHLGDAGLWSLSGLFYAGAALAILLEPFLSLRALTLALAVLLGLSGIARLLIGVREHVQWVLLSGCISIIAGTAIGMDWPRNSLMMVGSLAVLDLTALGMALILSGVSHRFAVIEEEN